jgi:hypothetical protein
MFQRFFCKSYIERFITGMYCMLPWGINLKITWKVTCSARRTCHISHVMHITCAECRMECFQLHVLSVLCTAKIAKSIAVKYVRKNTDNYILVIHICIKIFSIGRSIRVGLRREKLHRKLSCEPWTILPNQIGILPSPRLGFYEQIISFQQTL